ncbi:hypothetical protein ETH_00026300 [Eimeria tenella]|uniref:Uncharacterized protein n=1 Tax=Eimeria tenella TaxID=5802 RepID=U6KSG0_EIMTE|nr:hypothetical protein ETH_00026300 [Eimeria tenella]CDJ39873.1 hypothetical protein ETH_00026300 [Eimeria tenella]|eukprot:XP_013230626.1 hypothetical protein ETH_00026300 [Eimeria tenella]
MFRAEDCLGNLLARIPAALRGPQDGKMLRGFRPLPGYTGPWGESEGPPAAWAAPKGPQGAPWGPCEGSAQKGAYEERGETIVKGGAKELKGDRENSE